MRFVLGILVVAIVSLPNLSAALPQPAAYANGPIEIYGVDFEADTFVWALDRSCSMGWGGQIQTLKVEVTDAIAQLMPQQDVSAVAIADTGFPWNATAVPATSANQSALTSWVNGLVATGSSCFDDGIAQAIDAAASGVGPVRAVVLITDGVPTCSGPTFVQPAVDAANAVGVVIHTVLVDGAPASAGPILQDLAAQTGGIYVDPTQVIFPPQFEFVRGDVDDDGAFNLTDVIVTLDFLFISQTPVPCDDAADFTDDGMLDISDPVAGLAALFGGETLDGPLTCGEDPTADSLECDEFTTCP